MRGKARKYTLEEILPKYTLDDVIEDRDATEDNIAEIDRLLERLDAYIGRNLTEDEQCDILDIVDEYTPKDNKGNYLGPLLPFDYAWQIYKILHSSDKA